MGRDYTSQCKFDLTQETVIPVSDNFERSQCTTSKQEWRNDHAFYLRGAGFGGKSGDTESWQEQGASLCQRPMGEDVFAHHSRPGIICWRAFGERERVCSVSAAQSICSPAIGEQTDATGGLQDVCGSASRGCEQPRFIDRYFGTLSRGTAERYQLR